MYRALQKADTIGMFQVESRAQMSCLPRLRPKKFYDIVVQVAIIRPGPIVGKMVNPYLKRRQGRERVEYLHPSLEPVLKRTLGVPLFQEQLLRMAMIVAGFHRRRGRGVAPRHGLQALGKAHARDRSQAARRHDAQRHHAEEAQDRIMQSITSFALYGFPESHAASFALIAYASAYLKCHYLAAFTAAMLNNQPMGFYAPAILVNDARRHGLRVLPIDVTQSHVGVHGGRRARSEEGVRCQVSGARALRLGLMYVKGLRAEAGPAHRCASVRAGRFAISTIWRGAFLSCAKTK